MGPQARGIFDRLFGSNGGPPPVQTTGKEAISIAVASGKGGTGKSFVATNLAVLMHRAGQRVTVVDCDFGLACDHLLFGVSPKLTLQHLVSHKASLEDVCIGTPAGPSLIPGASGVRRMADLTDQELLALGRGLGEAASDTDVLVLDVGAGIAPQNVMTMLCADHIILVTEPEIAALTDAYAVIKCVAQLRDGVPFSVVVNRVAARGQGQRTYDKLAEVANRYADVNLGYLGEIAADPTVTQRRLGQLPIAMTDVESKTTASLQEILASLETAVGSFGQRRVEADVSLEARFREHRLFLC